MTPKKILFCADFSENSTPARHYAEDFSIAFGAELHVLHIVDPSPLGYPLFADRIPFDFVDLQAKIETSVAEELELVVKECGEKGVNVKAYYRTGKPSAEVIQYAEENSMDLIVMGTHGWTGIKHLVMGSTAENVVRLAKCPVLTVRASETS